MSLSTQNHIHLALAPDDIIAELPATRFKVSVRVPKPEGFVAIKRALDGTLRASALTDAGGPVVFKSFAYTLVVTQAQLEALEGLAFRTVYFLDNRHPDDGVDHTGAIRTMFFGRLGQAHPLDPLLNRHLVEIELTDGDTV